MSDSMFVLAHHIPQPYLGQDLLFNPEQTINETLKTSKTYASYLWSDGSQGPHLEVDSEGTYWVEVGDSNACFGRDSIVLRYWDPVSVSEVSVPEMSVFPNPSSSRLYVQAEGLKSLEIIDLKGSVVFSQSNLENEAEVHLNSLATGVYLLRGTSDKYIWVKRIGKM